MPSNRRQIRAVDFRSAWVALLGILFPLRLFHRALVSVGVSDGVIIFAVATAIGHRDWRQWLELRKDPLAKWIAGLSVSILIALVVGRLRLGHWNWWGLVNRGLALPVLLCVYCLFATVAKHKVWLYLRWFVIGGSLLNLPALAAVAVRYGLNRGSVFFFSYSSLRLSGLMHNPNAYGGFLAVLLSIQLSGLAFGKSIFGRQWMDSGNAAALLAAAAFTISRSSWIAILGGAVTVLVVAVATRRTMPRRTRDIAPAIVAAAATLGLLLMAGAGGLASLARDGVRAHTTIDSSGIYFPHGPASFAEFLRIARDPSGAGDRLAIDSTALQLYAASASRMAFGLGLGAFEEMASSTSLQTNVLIHNSYLWALVELGPLGAICLLAILLKILWRLWCTIGSDAVTGTSLAALFIALAAFCTWCLSNDGIYQRHLWFLLGLAAGATAPARSQPEAVVLATSAAD